MHGALPVSWELHTPVLEVVAVSPWATVSYDPEPSTTPPFAYQRAKG